MSIKFATHGCRITSHGINMLLNEKTLPGQSKFKNLVLQAYKNKRFPQSLILTGKDELGLQAYSLWVAQIILCENTENPACGNCSQCQKFQQLSHPDLHLIFPQTASATFEDQRNSIKSLAADPFQKLEINETSDVLIVSIREMNKLMSRSPFELDRRVIIIFHADRLRKESANAFLKTLEEPTKGTYFILVSTDPEQMLKTILSRCQQLTLDPFKQDEIQAFLENRGIEKNQAQKIALLADGKIENALGLNQTETRDFQSEMYNLLYPLLKGDLPRMLEVTGSWERTGREDVLGYLNGFSNILRDCNSVKENFSGGFTRHDLVEQHKAILTEYAKLDLTKCLQFSDDAIMKIHRNVSVSLVLLNLCIQMRKLIRAK